MDTLLHRFGAFIKGKIQGFDRVVFKGILLPIVHVAGMQAFLRYRGVLNKNYKEWVTEQSETIVEAANQYSKKNCGVGVTYIPSYKVRKEELAHEQQKKSGIDSGLIGVWSCVESCYTFRSTYDESAGYPQLLPNESRCKHLYFYYDHPELGFMSVRLQTWAPYNIQIALNGREWLRRSLDKEKCEYIINGNKFLHIDDYEVAQRLLKSRDLYVVIMRFSGIIVSYMLVTITIFNQRSKYSALPFCSFLALDGKTYENKITETQCDCYLSNAT